LTKDRRQRGTAQRRQHGKTDRRLGRTLTGDRKNISQGLVRTAHRRQERSVSLRQRKGVQRRQTRTAHSRQGRAAPRRHAVQLTGDRQEKPVEDRMEQLTRDVRVLFRGNVKNLTEVSKNSSWESGITARMRARRTADRKQLKQLKHLDIGQNILQETRKSAYKQCSRTASSQETGMVNGSEQMGPGGEEGGIVVQFSIDRLEQHTCDRVK